MRRSPYMEPLAFNTIPELHILSLCTPYTMSRATAHFKENRTTIYSGYQESITQESTLHQEIVNFRSDGNVDCTVAI